MPAFITAFLLSKGAPANTELSRFGGVHAFAFWVSSSKVPKGIKPQNKQEDIHSEQYPCSHPLTCLSMCLRVICAHCCFLPIIGPLYGAYTPPIWMHGF